MWLLEAPLQWKSSALTRKGVGYAKRRRWKCMGRNIRVVGIVQDTFEIRSDIYFIICGSGPISLIKVERGWSFFFRGNKIKHWGNFIVVKLNVNILTGLTQQIRYTLFEQSSFPFPIQFHVGMDTVDRKKGHCPYQKQYYQVSQHTINTPCQRLVYRALRTILTKNVFLLRELWLFIRNDRESAQKYISQNWGVQVK